MVLVDTSVWVDHFRRGDSTLVELLQQGRVATHPFVVGEIACGSLSGSHADRTSIIDLMRQLPKATVAQDDEVLTFIEHHRLFAKGVGYVDTHLLASTALSHHGSIWTRDKRLLKAAESIGLAASLAH